ncbi:UNVERIFIED_CONTAM: hypothetical protein FKN15_029369 [Acipenser sinensis]
MLLFLLSNKKERAQLVVWRQEKPRHSERKWDEVIQSVVKPPPESPQPPPDSLQPLPESPVLPEGEYPTPPRRE